MKKKRVGRRTRRKIIKTYAFVDAANLFYGGQKSLGWKIDYKKLLMYLRRKYKVKKVFYYAGVELEGFSYSILENRTIDLDKLIYFLKNKQERLSKERRKQIVTIIQRVKFYRKLDRFGYVLKLKPVKLFREKNGRVIKKANCDVDLTFDAMRYFDKYDGILLLSGDGDFAILLKYLMRKGKLVTVLARGERTAKEIRQLLGDKFTDFIKLRKALEFEVE